MLASMTVEQFEERMAADVLDPVDDSWQQAATITAAVVNELRAVVAAFAGGKPHKYQPVSDFIPTPKFMHKKKRPKPLDDEAKLRAAFGGK